MPKSAPYLARGFGQRANRQVDSWDDLVALGKRRLLEGLGFTLVVLCLLLVLCLATYSPADPSLDTAIDTTPANFLGRDGAFAADLLIQGLGLAAFLLPLILLGWAFRLLLQRPLRRMPRRFVMVFPALVFTALACAMLPATPIPMPAGTGGAVGWALLRGVHAVGLGALELPVAIGAGGLAALLLLSIMGLSWGDWRDVGSGAGRRATRLAVVSGQGAVVGAAVAVGFSQRVVERWRAARQEAAAAQAAAAKTAPAAVRALGPERPLPWMKPVSARPANAPSGAERREPLFGPAPAAARQPVPTPVTAAEPDASAHKVVRLVMPGTRSIGTGRRAELERQATLDLDGQPILPPIDLLTRPPVGRTETIDEEALAKNARLLEAVLEDYGVRGEIVQVRPGPVVTLYELEPAPGIKASRVIGLADDIARSMSAISVRVAVVPGRSVIGIELPNTKAETVYLRELLDSPAYEKHTGRLALALGKDIGGEAVVADLARMPHLLIAGTTGSGKSVGINTMILSILYRMPPDRCKFIMVDPKMLELSVYDGIPHLLAPVVTDPKKAVMALKWTVREMERRYQMMSKLGVRSIEGYNARIAEARDRGERLVRKVQTGFDPETGEPIIEEQPFDLTEFPLIVVIVDEMADLMLVAGKDIEASVQRLAQMARAAGIHIIMATQRPSVDVITGTIKANFPTRISFQVTSKIDSRTILGEGGAEQLLGRGDMLYMAGGGRVTRVHGPFVSDEEVERVVSALKSRAEPDYIDEITEDGAEGGGGGGGFADEDDGGSGDQLYDQAVALVTREKKASTSFVQRHLQIGYNRAARIIERMEQEGVVGTANHVGRREVLAPPPR
ncbi:MAG TPA: DNA translocase FtsK 4TM domain-containing protein [Stellaceae bacterium]|nr:DNA translocase FtsK 4TM domain-containing protein [Stellaceae bacterium]